MREGGRSEAPCVQLPGACLGPFQAAPHLAPVKPMGGGNGTGDTGYDAFGPVHSGLVCIAKAQLLVMGVCLLCMALQLSDTSEQSSGASNTL